MGIPGLWECFDPAVKRESLLTVGASSAKGLRVAVDAAIWGVQCDASVGGDNPALRTLLHRLCRFSNNCIEAIFVFDGPEKPAFKRGKHVGLHDRPLFEELIELFGYECWHAPGEAEAECAQLQKAGIVDAVVSDDVDSLMFGADKVFRFWASADEHNRKSDSARTHTLTYTSDEIKRQCGMGVNEMILVALLAGGDYHPAGVPSCGIKTAIEIAKAGFGNSLLVEGRDLPAWRESLQELLNHNSEKRLHSKRPSVRIPADFPNAEILSYYTSPAVSCFEDLKRMQAARTWHRDIKVDALHAFVKEHLGWQGLDGLATLVRSIAQPVFTRHLQQTRRAKQLSPSQSQTRRSRAAKGYLETMRRYTFTIHGLRQHKSADLQNELRVSYIPVKITALIPAFERESLEPQIISCDTQHDLSTRDTDIRDSGMPDQPTPMDAPFTSSSLLVTHRPKKAFDFAAPERQWILESLLFDAYPDTVAEFKQAQALKSPTKVYARTNTLDQYFSVRTKVVGRTSQAKLDSFQLDSVKRAQLVCTAQSRSEVSARPAQSSSQVEGGSAPATSTCKIYKKDKPMVDGAVHNINPCSTINQSWSVKREIIEID